MSQIEVGIVAYTVSADYIATMGADFDSETADDTVLAELNTMVPEGVVVHRNGKVFAEEAVAEEARSIQWDDLLGRIDVEQILARSGRTPDTV
ncbi:hypothetical protein [Subtercola boreus]|uniref:Uncharacterized protein n=1 Tax=Subtercola boreus TaxID=120213 RepID=A0A3E0WB57_9MICO|nr:hypothetical protein [Subtercola boreus]RFA20587.1 hypothetical protein B7R24_09145 [Subtercola boreus]RFA20702.1 hypothetical protein B7R23_09080 [Subtercola boreus]RFA26912.1 hypothetical protein B7R25_09210 [Subtercola boreus]